MKGCTPKMLCQRANLQFALESLEIGRAGLQANLNVKAEIAELVICDRLLLALPKTDAEDLLHFGAQNLAVLLVQAYCSRARLIGDLVLRVSVALCWQNRLLQ